MEALTGPVRQAGVRDVTDEGVTEAHRSRSSSTARNSCRRVSVRSTGTSSASTAPKYIDVKRRRRAPRPVAAEPGHRRPAGRRVPRSSLRSCSATRRHRCRRATRSSSSRRNSGLPSARSTSPPATCCGKGRVARRREHELGCRVAIEWLEHDSLDPVSHASSTSPASDAPARQADEPRCSVDTRASARTRSPDASSIQCVSSKTMIVGSVEQRAEELHHDLFGALPAERVIELRRRRPSRGCRARVERRGATATAAGQERTTETSCSRRVAPRPSRLRRR